MDPDGTLPILKNTGIGQIIISGGWSKSEITEGPPMQLYKLDEDISERNNLYLEMPEKAVELQALLEVYKKEGRSRFK